MKTVIATIEIMGKEISFEIEVDKAFDTLTAYEQTSILQKAIDKRTYLTWDDKRSC